MRSSEYRELNEPHPFDPELPRLTQKMIRDIGGLDPMTVTVLDIGCGVGRLVEELRVAGMAAHGCDVEAFWGDESRYFRQIEWDPYRIPFDDGSVDVVVTNTILEHVQNHAELYSEIRRVLRPGGVAIHTLPGRWYLRAGKWFLPVEPHIRVPFVHFFWPKPRRRPVPRSWLALWAFLGFRSPYQEGKGWRETTEANIEFCKDSICYLSHREHRELSNRVFGNCEYPMHYFLNNAYGGAAQLYRRLPLKRFTAWALKHTRIALLVQRK